MADQGHRALPHTADVIVEAWAPSRAECVAEAVRALVGSFADASDVAATRPLPVTLDPADDESLLVAALEEAIYVVDALGVVPVSVELEDAEDGGIAGFFDVADVSLVRGVGALPKAVAYTDLRFARDGGAWRCRVTIDV